MGRTNRERRAAARRRKVQQQSRAAGAQGPTAAPPTHQALDAQLGAAITALWEHGWQPADLVHAVRRLGDGRLARLTARLVLGHAAATDAAARAPEAWLRQLRALPARPGRRPGDLGVERWADDEDLAPAEARAKALQLLTILRQRPALAELGPPPSRWHEPRVARRPGVVVDDKLLGRIRALLAKAEATTFPEEADTFTAKAQELMARHAIDHAMLRAAATAAGASDVESRRIHVNDPYAEAKALLLSVVASANGGRAVWDHEHGFATVLAHATDLELVELLFTSLLVQATQAAGAAGRVATRGRAPSFRRAFLTSYAVRIGDRLDEARRHVEHEAVAQHGAALLPVLTARQDEVDEAVRAAFPRLQSRAPRSFDAQGWHAGTLAADLAELGTDRSPLER
jgi:Protein of unknown function (DUF2786)